MKYFTREWCLGEYDDATADSVCMLYEAHLAKIWDVLPDSLKHISKNISIHDGLFSIVLYNRSKRILIIHITCGDLQVGYYDLKLVYNNTYIEDAELCAWQGWIMNDDTEIIYDEIDVTHDIRYEHRILLEPEGEMRIVFQELQYSIHSIKGRDRTMNVPRFKIID